MNLSLLFNTFSKLLSIKINIQKSLLLSYLYYNYCSSIFELCVQQKHFSMKPIMILTTNPVINNAIGKMSWLKPNGFWKMNFTFLYQVYKKVSNLTFISSHLMFEVIAQSFQILSMMPDFFISKSVRFIGLRKGLSLAKGIDNH